MKKAIIFSTLLLMCSCIGKMEDLSLSTDSVIFTAEESSYVVTSEVELEIEIVNENNSEENRYASISLR